MIMNWGPTQSLMKQILTMNAEEIKESINYIEVLLKSKKYNYDEKFLLTRLKNLKEELEFLTKC